MASSEPSVTSLRDGGLIRRKNLIGARAASEQMWGAAGVERICADLPADVAERLNGMQPLPEWVPVADFIAWNIAVWQGPARRDEATMARHSRLTVDHGFGRVKRLVVAALTPQALAERATALWREEYSTGQLRLLSVEKQSLEVVLSEHVYVEVPLMRHVITEVYRYILSMAHTKDVTATHRVDQTTLIVTLRWK